MFRTKCGCLSVRCERKDCRDAYRRTVDALGVNSLGEDSHAYVDVNIYMIGGAFHTATLAREDVDNLTDPKWRRKVHTFHIPVSATGGVLHIFTNMITGVEETSRDDY